MSFNSGLPKSLSNLREWLPSYGETDVNTRSKDSTLYVSVQYDDAEPSTSLSCKTFKFEKFCSFMISAVPGVSILDIKYKRPDPTIVLNHLVVYEDSEAAAAWNKHFAWASGKIKHYEIYFTSSNRTLVCFAQDVSLIDGETNS